MESASFVGCKIVNKGDIVFNRFKARLLLYPIMKVSSAQTMQFTNVKILPTQDIL